MDYRLLSVDEIAERLDMPVEEAKAYITTPEGRRKYKQENVEFLFEEYGDAEAADYISMCGTDPKYGDSVGLLYYYIDDFCGGEVLYNLLKEVYCQNGYGFPEELMKYFLTERPENYLSELDTLIPVKENYTVYRATKNTEFLEDQISWTIDLNVAVWFAHRFDAMKIPPLKIYKGLIRREDIIAYISDRNEEEIVQYGAVTDIEEIILSDTEVSECLENKKNGRKKIEL